MFNISEVKKDRLFQHLLILFVTERVLKFSYPHQYQHKTPDLKFFILIFLYFVILKDLIC